MGKRTAGTVATAFPDATEHAFAFLVAELGLAGPDRQGTVIPVVAYHGTGLRYRIMLDDYHTVLTRVEIDTNTGRLVADLENLAVAARLAKRNSMSSSAHNLSQLQHSIQAQAQLVRALHPLMTAPNNDIVELMDAAKARQWHQ